MSCIINPYLNSGLIPLLTYRGTYVSTTDAIGYTSSAIAIGDAHANRFVVAGIYGNRSASGAPPVNIHNVVIGGVSAPTPLVRAVDESIPGGIFNGECSLWGALVPTGTTATVAWTTDSTAPSEGSFQGACAVWTITDLVSTTPTDTAVSENGTTASTAGMTIDCLANGVIIGYAYMKVPNTNYAHSGASSTFIAPQTNLAITAAVSGVTRIWTGLFENFDATTETTATSTSNNVVAVASFR